MGEQRQNTWLSDGHLHATTRVRTINNTINININNSSVDGRPQGASSTGDFAVANMSTLSISLCRVHVA